MSTRDEDEWEEGARLLRNARPEPTERFVQRTERDLFGRSRRAKARRPLLAGLGFAGGLAGAVIVTGLIGGGPLAVDGQDEVRAREECRTVQVTTAEPSGRLVTRPDGTATVVTTSRAVPRPQQRCR